MPIVKLFKSRPEEIGKADSMALSLLEVEMETFTLELGIEVVQVNGPYVSRLPPEKEGGPERAIYSGNVVYHLKRNEV